MRTGTLEFGRPTGEGFGPGATWHQLAGFSEEGTVDGCPGRSRIDGVEGGPIGHQIDDPADGALMGALSTRFGHAPSAGLAFFGATQQVASYAPLHRARQPVPRFVPENARRIPARPATDRSCRTHTEVKGPIGCFTMSGSS